MNIKNIVKGISFINANKEIISKTIKKGLESFEVNEQIIKEKIENFKKYSVDNKEAINKAVDKTSIAFNSFVSKVKEKIK